MKTEDALKDKIVGVYFSAHWCVPPPPPPWRRLSSPPHRVNIARHPRPNLRSSHHRARPSLRSRRCPPCRQFTPIFGEIYKELKSRGKNFEVVFASSDRDEASFAEYHGEQPWLAMPFANRDLKNKLSAKYKVQGIPTLVILDENGDVITKDGRSAVMKDPEAFPWTPPTLAEALGESFVRADGSEVSLASIAKSGANVGVYFSAHWCGPCRQFTPKLIEAYDKMLGDQTKPFEVIFVSGDRDEAGFKEYFGSMPWLAVPFDDEKRRDALNEYFGVQGIPHFVMLTSELKMINPNARGSVMSDPTCEEFPWRPKLVTDVDEDCEGINDTTAVVLLMEECGDDWDDLTAAITAVAKDVKEAEEARGEDERSTLFMTVTETGGGIGAQLRKLCGLGRAASGVPQLVLLDLGVGRYVKLESKDVTKDAIATLLADYRAGKLELQSPNPAR